MSKRRLQTKTLLHAKNPSRYLLKSKQTACLLRHLPDLLLVALLPDGGVLRTARPVGQLPDDYVQLDLNLGAVHPVRHLAPYVPALHSCQSGARVMERSCTSEDPFCISPEQDAPDNRVGHLVPIHNHASFLPDAAPVRLYISPPPPSD